MDKLFCVLQTRISQLYVLCVFTFMTWYVRNGYFDILESKSTIVVCFSFFYSVIMMMLCILRIGFTESVEIRFWKSFRKLDWSIIAFGLCAMMSTVFSVHPRMAFWGSDGLCMGSVFLLCMVVTYLFLSRWFLPEKWLLGIFLTSGIITFIWGIADCFDADWMNWRVNMGSSHYDFLSTIGNRDWYVGYLALTVPFVAGLFLYENKKRWLWLYRIYLVLGFISIYITKNDGNLLIFGCGIFLVWCALEKEETWNRLIQLMWLFVFASIFVKLGGVFVDQTHLTGISILGRLTDWNWYIGIAGFGILLWLLRTWIVRKNTKKIWLFFSCLVIGSLFLAVICTFDGGFGSDRGYIWEYAVRTFGKSNTIQKVFGWGPDCFKTAVYTMEEKLIVSTWPELNQVANAHNEWLQYLITMGLLGMLAYTVIYFCVVKKILDSERKVMVALGLSFFSYGCTALGNNPQPLNYAVWFVLLALIRFYSANSTKSDGEI